MEGKRGKLGRKGRTFRSQFSQIKGGRVEGLLIHSSGVSSLQDEDQSVEEVITYSLGKHNRWLLPEVIKTGCVSSGNDEELVLVERYANASHRKPTRADCISVFNSKNGTLRKPRRKLAHTKDLLRDDEKIKSRFEVTYPNLSGSWSIRPKKPFRHHGKRKKNNYNYSSTSDCLLEDYDDEVVETDFDSEFEEDFGEQLDRSSSLGLDMLMRNSSSVPQTHYGKEMSSLNKNWRDKQIEPEQTKRHFLVNDGTEMHQRHLEYLEEIKAGSSLLDSREEQIQSNKNIRNPEVGKKRRRRARNPALSSVAGSKVANESVLQLKTCSDPVECPNPDIDDGIVLMMRKHEIIPETLAQQWHHMYKEGSSYPRTFSLNLTSLIPLSTGDEVFVAFRVLGDHERCHSGEIKAVLNMAVYRDGMDDYNKTVSDLISQISMMQSDQKIWTIQEITDLAISFHLELAKNKTVKVHCKEPRKPRLSLDVFQDLCGWTSKAFSSHTAKYQVKKCLSEVTGHPEMSTAAIPLDSNFVMMEFCGICFQEVKDREHDGTIPFLFLNACGHKFCNSCWRAHLKTQIDLGQMKLSCPAHECSIEVDDVTLMSLAPSLFERHLAKRVNTMLEISPKWKWCPADQCKLVVKGTTLQDSSKIHYAENSGGVQPLPVVCVCGTMWCFKCQKDAHWPATCEEAQEFRQKNASYARFATRKEKELITSVQVKRCPSCYYPVEKGLGCNHMTCILCRKEFCWSCLGDWSASNINHSQCRLIQLTKIQLTTKCINIVSYQHIAVTSRVARASSLICQIHRKLDKIEHDLNIYTKCFPLRPELKKRSRTEQRLKMLCENNAFHLLKKVFNFKFQAHLALEGLAIRLSFSNGAGCSKKLALEFSRLLFIVERMENILQDINCCLVRRESLSKLGHFIKFGKKCILSIGRRVNEHQ